MTVKAPLKELYQHILGMARITLCEENLLSHVGKIKSHSVAKRHLGMLKLRCGAFHAPCSICLTTRSRVHFLLIGGTKE